MKISDIFVILLFIIPGAVAEKVSYSMDMPSGEKRTEFRELINGILWSLPIIIIVSPIMCIIFHIWTVDEFSNKFNNILFLAVFSALALLFAFFIGFLRGYHADKITKLVNKVRTKNNKMSIDSKSCWRKIFLDNPDCHFVEIIKDGNSYEGFTKEYSLPNEEKEIVMYLPDYLQQDPYYSGYRKKFNIVNQIYVNIEKNIVIKDYDMEEYYKWLKEKIKNRN